MKEWIVKNRVKIIFIIFFLLILFQQQFLWLYHDDYGYASLNYAVDIGNIGNNYSLFDIFKFLNLHYIAWGGRMISIFFECFLLKFGLPVYRLVQSLVIVFIFYFIYKILKDKTKLKDYQLAILTICMYGFLEIMFLRNSVFWISASVGYLFPMLPFFVLVYSFHQSKFKGIPLSIFQCVLAFLIAFSHEQSASMVVTYLILEFIDEYFLNKNKNSKKNLIVLFSSLIGFALIAVSPGSYSRLNNATDLTFGSKSILEKLMLTIPNLINNFFTLKNNLYLSIFLIAIAYISIKNIMKKKNIISNIASFSNLIIILFSFCLSTNNYFTYFLNVFSNNLLIYLVFVVQLLLLIYSIIVYFYKKDHLFIKLFISGVGSLSVMLLAPYFPARASLGFIFLSFPLIIYVIGKLIENKSYQKYILICIVILSSCNFISITRGYQKNDEANKNNDYILNETSKKIKNGENIKVITLKKLPNILFSGDQPYFENSDYIKFWMKKYYELPEEVDINYID